MPPQIEPAIAAAGSNKSEMSIPCAPSGGIANLDRNVPPPSGVASRAKRSRFIHVDAPGSAGIFPRRDGTALPVAFAIARVGVIGRSLVDHCAEQESSGR